VQWWTHGRPPQLSLDPGTPAAVVVSGRTFSSGEALAFHLQQLCGLPVVGVRSRGAADHITPVRVTADVTAFLPEAYVVDASSGGSWEGRGVVPDVTATEADAREEAFGLVAARTPRAPLP
jgi:C-terminal processing protease CtpA/Prc